MTLFSHKCFDKLAIYHAVLYTANRIFSLNLIWYSNGKGKRGGEGECENTAGGGKGGKGGR